MSQSDQTLEEREKELSARIQTLERQLDRLSARMGDGNDPGVPHSPVPAAAAAREKEYEPDEITDVSEEVLNWAGRTSLLPRLATLCFLLVVALILRTITDSGLVNALVGSGIGMSYAAILMIAGWFKYREQSPLAPIIAASGAILMSTIVVETHSRFNSLPLVPAYLTLMATGIGMALISRRFNAFTPISVGILGMCFAGAAIDYPHPFFPYLSLVLFTANLLGYFAAQLKRCSWLRWSALFVTMVMLQLWQVQIVTSLRKGETAAPELAISWFLPVMAVFAVTYILLALLGIVRSGTDKISKFELALPTLNITWAFSAAIYVVSAQGGNTYLLGVIGVVAAIGHLAATFWLARRGIAGTPGASSFTFASGVLLALALPAATGKFLLSLPIISLVALFMAVMSRKWGSGTIRVTTYLFQIYCSAAVVFAFLGDSPAAMGAVNMLPVGLLTCIILYQYQWCRLLPPAPESSFFGRFDKNDRSGVLLLLAGLINGFYMIRIALFQAMPMLPAEMQRDAFRCSQSVLINCAAIALILFAFLRKNKEIRNVAILVMVIGGIKVFLYDLTRTHGLPLVFSVFSFGMAAAVESIALGKWQKQPADRRENEPVDGI
ncbi:MAG: DUF2339 domain-containing protein [Desulfuromonadaceae bacterium]|nr:DUF2339 domain-containing protein [Desulfuromonadaceae bacterium]